MKILCVIDSLGSGGAQRQLVGLAIGFKERGHEVSFLVYHEEDFFNKQLDDANIPVRKVLESNYFKRFFKMRRYIRKGNFDAVLSFLEAANFICELSGFPFRKWKLVVGERSANPNIKKSIKLRIYRWFHLMADYTVANSLANMKIIRSINPLLKKNKCKVIYNMIDTKTWKPLNNYEYRRNVKTNIIVIARHKYLKNLNGFIEALSLLTNQQLHKINVEW